MTSGRGTRLENGSDESLLQAMLTNIFYSADVSFGNTPAPEPARKTEKKKNNSLQHSHNIRIDQHSGTDPREAVS